MNYYSPELVRYIQGSAAASELSPASDVFALALIYAEYLTGTVPSFDPVHHQPAIAVLHGAHLRLAPSRAPGPVVALVERMLALDPAARPSVGEVHATLMGVRSDVPTTPARPLRTTTAPALPPPGSRLRGKGLRLASRGERPAVAPAPGRGAGRTLLGKLLGMREKR
jgi:serine/threonine protein kinase